MDADLTPDSVQQIGNLVGMKLPQGRATAIARELQAAAARIGHATVTPGFDDEPATFQRIQRQGLRR